MNLNLNDEWIQQIQKNLLNWFENTGRRFPWRETKNPYRVLLAEKLLQQTSVKPILVDIYHQLLTNFPTIYQLAKANPDDVKRIISPLGLHYRAIEIVRMANEIKARFNGEVPNSLKDLLSIYGVGEYSARAVLCFAYGQDIPLVDTNIARILHRVFGIKEPIPANPARKKSLIRLAGVILPEGRSSQFNWAMIDHGASICISRKPLCKNCPINHFCVYYKEVVED